MILSCQIWKPVHIAHILFCALNSGIGYKLVKQWFYNTQEMLFMSREFYFFVKFKDFWWQTCDSLDINLTQNESCNHGSKHPLLQSLELHTTLHFLGPAKEACLNSSLMCHSHNPRFYSLNCTGNIISLYPYFEDMLYISFFFTYAGLSTMN